MVSLMDIENLIMQLETNSDTNKRSILEQGLSIESRKQMGDSDSFLDLALPKIRIIGVGGAGNNFASALFSQVSSKLVEVIAINTDASQLAITKAHTKILIGRNTTRGYGAGNDPLLGRKAFEESKESIARVLEEADLLVVTAGLGGGTGSGVAPELINMASDLGILTVAFVTMPFKCEGKVRIRNALDALNRIMENPVVTIVVPNERLVKIAPRKTIQGAFDLANNLLIQLVSSIADLIEKPGLINVDFADVRKILSYKGLAIPGVAVVDGGDEKRALTAAEKILSNPLLDVNPSLAKGALIEIVSGSDLLLTEAYDIVNKFTATMGEEKEVIFGLRIEDNYNSKIKVVSLITGIEILGNNIDSRWTDAVIIGETLTQPAPNEKQYL